MNDRLKFRVFVTENEAYPDEVGYIDTEHFYIHPEGDIGFFNADYDYADYVVEQCTGLKDKNGKLIYEGDLIKSPNNSNLLEVIWEESSWHTKEYKPNGRNELILDSLVAFYGVEIVGNIHEVE